MKIAYLAISCLWSITSVLNGMAYIQTGEVLNLVIAGVALFLAIIRFNDYLSKGK